MQYDIRQVTTIVLTDENGNELGGAEQKFAEWMLEVLERGWLANNSSISAFSIKTRLSIVAEALSSEPRGLGAFRTTARIREASKYKYSPCECGWEYSPKSKTNIDDPETLHYRKIASMRTHKARCNWEDTQ